MFSYTVYLVSNTILANALLIEGDSNTFEIKTMDVQQYLSGKWLIKLKDDESDLLMLRQIRTLIAAFAPKELHFLHTYKSDDIPSVLLSEIPDLETPTIEQKRERLTKVIEGKLKTDVKIILDVREGSPLTEMLSYAVEKETDLTINMQRPFESRSRDINLKLARKNPSPLLILPHNNALQLEHITFTTDFSKHSMEAFDWVLTLAGLLNPKNTIALNVYMLAEHFARNTYYTRSEIENLMDEREKINQKLKSYSEYKLQSLVQGANKKGIKLLSRSIPQKVNSVSRNISDYVHQLGPGIIVISPRGNNYLIATLLGSTAEEVITQNPEQGILITREKGSNLKLVDALLNLWR